MFESDSNMDWAEIQRRRGRLLKSLKIYFSLLAENIERC